MTISVPDIKTILQFNKFSIKLADSLRKAWENSGAWQQIVKANHLMNYPPFWREHVKEQLLKALQPMGYVTMIYHKTFSSSGSYQILRKIPSHDLWKAVKSFV